MDQYELWTCNCVGSLVTLAISDSDGDSRLRAGEVIVWIIEARADGTGFNHCAINGKCVATEAG